MPARVFVFGSHARGDVHDDSDLDFLVVESGDQPPTAQKSVLVIHGVAFRRAHDLSYLLQVAEDGNVEIPEDVAAARWLTPWAAEFRYDEHEIAGFSRAESLHSAQRAIEWAQAVFDAAS